MWMVFGCAAFLGSIFWPATFAQPHGAHVFFSPKIKRLISGFYVIGMVVALTVTIIWDISKLHLLWFVPLWHFLGTQWIGLIYEKVTLRRRGLFSSETLGNIMPSDALKDMYDNYRGAAKALQENGYSNEEAFWICFALMSLQAFYKEEDAKVLGIDNEIRLSEILERQLAIYCEEVNREMKSKEVCPFLNLLKEKFDEIRNVVFESHPDNYSSASRDLCRVLYRLSGETNIQHAVAGTQYVLKMIYELSKDGPEPLKLIRDV